MIQILAYCILGFAVIIFALDIIVLIKKKFRRKEKGGEKDV